MESRATLHRPDQFRRNPPQGVEAEETPGWGTDGPLGLPVLGKQRLLAGLEQGITGMRVGGRRLLVVPSALAFGSEGNGGTIGPDETMVFVVDLVALK